MPDKTLTLFLSNGGSLIRWQKDGILSREILLYLYFLRTGIFDRVRIFSYHGGDAAYVKQLAAADPVFHGIEIVAPSRGREKRGIGRVLWSVWGPLRHRPAIARSVALKTNQVSGSWSAILSHWITGRPLVFRMGYLLSRRFRMNGNRTWERVARVVERIACGAASHILVTSDNAAEHLNAEGAAVGKVVVTPTYVDVKRFKPVIDYDFDKPVIAVGRLTGQKNLENLIRGCALAQRGLVLVGKGPKEQELRALAAELGVAVTFAGQMQNDELARMLRQHAIFAIPSLHEGLPKALIEAMACGLICIGSNIPGVTDLITNGKTGYLISGFEPEAIAGTIMRAYGERRTEFGHAARALIEQKFSLEHYAQREASLYGALA